MKRGGVIASLLTLGAGVALATRAKPASSRKGGVSKPPVQPPVPGAPRMTLGQLRELARVTGFPESSVDTAAAVAMAESGGNPNALGDLSLGVSYGLWQINSRAHPQYDPRSLYAPDYNANAALEISRGGSNWNPWTTYRTGAFKRWMP